MRGVGVLLVLATGCVGLNAEFQASGASSGGEAQTQGPQSSDEGASSVTTGADDGSAGSDAAVTSAGESVSSGSPPATSTSKGESSTGTPPSCSVQREAVDDDAFLIECSTADCAGLNFGATPEHPLGRNSDAAHLLLRVPVVSEQATRVEVEAMLGPNPPGATGIYVLVAYAIDPPCVWVPGSQDAAPLGLGMDGVTWADCNANPDARVPWGGPQGALEHLSPAWGTGEVEVDLATLDPENPSIVAISLDRAEPGPAPRAVLLMVEEVTDTMPFVAFTNESAVHMHVEVTDCP